MVCASNLRNQFLKFTSMPARIGESSLRNRLLKFVSKLAMIGKNKYIGQGGVCVWGGGGSGG